MPNDGDMLGLLSAWVPEAAMRDGILGEDPARLYDFTGV